MSKKSGPNSLANLLRQQGQVPFASENNKINPIGYIKVDKQKYRKLWSNYDLNQCVARYVWGNLPAGIDSWNLERMLYFRSTLIGFEIGGQQYILPYVVQGELNPYGFPTNVKAITFNGREVAGKNDDFINDYVMPVDITGTMGRVGAVILYDNVPYMPNGTMPSRYLLNQIIINEMADVFARVNINVVVSNKKIMLEIPDPKQADIVREELNNAFGSDSPFAIVSTPFKSNPIQNTSDYNADDLFNTIKNYDAIRCFMSGIMSKNFGTEKKERLVSGELAGNEEEISLILDMGLELRKNFADTMNKKFGLNITVRKRNEDYDDDVNGLGQTQEEVEGEL